LGDWPRQGGARKKPLALLFPFERLIYLAEAHAITIRFDGRFGQATRSAKKTARRTLLGNEECGTLKCHARRERTAVWTAHPGTKLLASNGA
jgi:hypothetical protein